MRLSVQKMCASALLIAAGILIPLFSPLRVVLEPASFTLASHVAIFIAMMISPGVAVCVAVGTAAGFLFSAPLVVAMRAATHIIFAYIGAAYLKNNPSTLESAPRAQMFSLVIGLIHAAAEVAVVIPFFFAGGMNAGFYNKGFIISVVLLVGVGSVIHSMADFLIALAIHKVLSKQTYFTRVVASK